MYNILVVDDTVENIDVLTGMLRGEYSIKAATSGPMALKVAEKTQPDLILLDIMMPGMDGYEVCRLLKSNPFTSGIPVIFVTAKDQDVDEVSGFEAGAVDYLTKPVNPAIARARIKTQIALADQKKALEMEVAERTEEISRTRLQVIKKLGLAAEYKDSYTGMHIERMSRYCYHIAKAYGFSENLAELILHASPMHDVGKIGIPDSILKKPGKLDAAEWEIMTSHAFIGGDIIGQSSSELLNTAKVIAEQHHEKWNGEGYPRQLKGKDIDVFARIAAVADVFDALTSERPYKDAWPVSRATELIRSEAGIHFDPEVVAAFDAAMPEMLNIRARFSD